MRQIVARTSNPYLEPTSKAQPERVKTLLLANLAVWHRAVLLEAERYAAGTKGTHDALIDLSFFLVAVQRLREVADAAAARLKLGAARTALADFDRSWPGLAHVRNIQEHILLPKSDPTEPRISGLAYIEDAISFIDSSGLVTALVHIRDTVPDLEVLCRETKAALDSFSG